LFPGIELFPAEATAVLQLPFPETQKVKWLFHQEKAAFRNFKNGYMYCGTALGV